MVEHVDEDAHFLLFDVAVLLAIEDVETELKDVFFLEQTVGGHARNPFRKCQLLVVVYAWHGARVMAREETWFRDAGIWSSTPGRRAYVDDSGIWFLFV